MVDIDEILKTDITVPIGEFSGLYTNTALFMLPCIGYDIKQHLLKACLVNVYYDDFCLEHDFQRPIFILLRTPTYVDTNYVKLDNSFNNNPYFIYSYDVGSNIDKDRLVMYVFEVPDDYATDYILFKQGRYSQFSPQLKSKYIQFLKVGSVLIESLVWGIVNKSTIRIQEVARQLATDSADYESLKFMLAESDEIWEKPNEKNEIFRYGSIN